MPTRPVFRCPLPDGKRSHRGPLPLTLLPHPQLHPPGPCATTSRPYISAPSPPWRRVFLTTAAGPYSTSSSRQADPRQTSSSKDSSKMAAENTAKWEAQLKRNPHGNFKEVEASRPPFDTSSTFRYTQTPDPSWTFGSGANSLAPATPPAHVAIDPYHPERPAAFNYKLLISAVIPRPVAFLSTRSPDGTSTNLAPFSYFQMIAHDPPLFVVGFSGPLDEPRTKDSLRNLAATRECVINIIGEDYIEAANSTSVNAPYGASEWDVSGLTPVYDCETVPRVARVGEAVFSIEAKLESVREFEGRATPGKKTATMAVLEGTRFWAREDAINEERNILDPKVLRPVSRLGGITYSRVTEAIELPRPDFEKDLGGAEGLGKLGNKHLTN